MSDTTFPPGDALYARFNEWGGHVYVVTWDKIHSDLGLNGWRGEWDRDRDVWFVWRIERANGHELHRVRTVR